MTKIYKICTKQQWNSIEDSQIFKGAPIDLQDSYIHFSTKETLKETYNKYFSSLDEELIIFEVDSACLSSTDLKWEKSRNDQLFPHLYRDLNYTEITWFMPAIEAFTKLDI